MRTHWQRALASAALLPLLPALSLCASAADVPKFNREIRPILADNCFTCHGADKAARKSDLRLDQRATALKGGESGDPAIVPGKPESSELFKRLASADPEEVMPPPKTKKKLTPEQVETLRKWVAGGAEYEEHWAFIKPERPAVPVVGDATWARNEIDGFVAARMAKAGLKHAAEAEARTLCRRLYLDLNGIPPTPEEMRRFLDAHARDPQAALDQLVDTLLGSPRYGEQMAPQWLDLARYADTSGFQGDPRRTMWRWRDYVIESFNANKPFDQFTIEQIAGDLLPNATVEQRLATAFHRNHRFNTEFGAVDEEWKVENVVDRVEAVSGTWLGLTMGCGRCHDHKFDPITQRDFYSFFAFFNNIPERGVFWDVFGDYNLAFAPNMRAPIPADAEKLRKLDDKVAAATLKMEESDKGLATEQAAWEAAHAGEVPANWIKEPANLIVHLPLDGSLEAKFGERVILAPKDKDGKPVDGGKETTVRFVDTVKVVTEEAVAGGGLRATEQLGKVSFVEGALSQGMRPDGVGPLVAVLNEPSQPVVSFALWVKPEAADTVIFSKLGKQTLYPYGIELSLHGGRLHLEIHHAAFDDFDGTMVPVIMDATESLPEGAWSHVAVVLDGQRHNRGPTLFVNGRELFIEPKFACARGLTTFCIPTEPLVLGGSSAGKVLRGALDDFRLYDRKLSNDEVALLAALRGADALAKPAGQRSADEQGAASAYFRDFISPAHDAARKELRAAQKASRDFERQIPLVMVMQERPTPAAAKVLFRGQYDQPRETVSAAVPVSLGQIPADAPANRIGLARWLVAPENPLTARVFVNRLWERYFGTGLVKTSENLGAQADPPSHPELLDWLATEFVRRGWDVQAMVKLIVSSATYRQSSVLNPEALERDPENRWLARGPRFRLGAEAIRDSALAVSGLLVEQIGGPSVRPYLPREARQPGPDLYRRSLYAIWERTNFNPSLANFDATAREACALKRPRTNTPLQALSLLNEVTYVEAARKLAERMMQAGPVAQDRLKAGFALALAREPSAAESAVLAGLLEKHLAEFQRDPNAATQLLAQGTTRSADTFAATELAAYSMVAGVILNTDEFITKE